MTHPTRILAARKNRVWTVRVWLGISFRDASSPTWLAAVREALALF